MFASRRPAPNIGGGATKGLFLRSRKRGFTLEQERIVVFGGGAWQTEAGSGGTRTRDLSLSPGARRPPHEVRQEEGIVSVCRSRDQLGAFGPRPSSKKRRKSRTAFTNHQIYELEKRFLYQKYLSPADRDHIAAQLGLSNAQVITWFQNRRAKLKRDLEEMKADVERSLPCRDHLNLPLKSRPPVSLHPAWNFTAFQGINSFTGPERHLKPWEPLPDDIDVEEHWDQASPSSRLPGVFPQAGPLAALEGCLLEAVIGHPGGWIG
ncbi:Transcription factor LBX1, partial [Ophiophagus hannah]